MIEHFTEIQRLQSSMTELLLPEIESVHFPTYTLDSYEGPGMFVRCRMDGSPDQKRVSTITIQQSWSDDYRVAVNTFIPLSLVTKSGDEFMVSLVFGAPEVARKQAGMIAQFIQAERAKGHTIKVIFGAEQQSGDFVKYKPVVGFSAHNESSKVAEYLLPEIKK